MDDTFNTVISILVLVSGSHTPSNGCGYVKLYMYSVLHFSCKFMNTNNQLSTVIKVWYRKQTLQFSDRERGEIIFINMY